MRVFDAAVAKDFGGKREDRLDRGLRRRKGERAVRQLAARRDLEAFKKYYVGIKGPLTTPVGGGIRSLNVALRQMLDLYVCLRPVRYFKGVPSPVKAPEKVDMVIFRENTEDIYAGIEWAAESPEAKKVIAFLQNEMGVKKIRFPETSGIGIKPVSREGSERLIRARHRVRHPAQAQERDPGAQGQHHEVHRGGLPRLGLRAGEARVRRGAPSRLGRLRRQAAGRARSSSRTPSPTSCCSRCSPAPTSSTCIATLNLNGDYLSDALAAQVGGIGIAPGGNINYVTGHAVFEATHGTAPKYANLDKVNPGSVILSGVMMLEHLGWTRSGRRGSSRAWRRPSRTRPSPMTSRA